MAGSNAITIPAGANLTTSCPYCAEPIEEGTERCPHCGESPRPGGPERQVFKPGFVPGYLGFGLLVTGLVATLWMLDDRPPPLPYLAAIVLFGFAVLSPVITVLLQVWYSVVIRGGEVRACDTWGLRPWFKWSDIISARRIPLPWMPVARVKLRGRFSALWIPLFMDDLAGFRGEVEANTPEDNPLRQVLARGQSSDR